MSVSHTSGAGAAFAGPEDTLEARMLIPTHMTGVDCADDPEEVARPKRHRQRGTGPGPRHRPRSAGPSVSVSADVR